MEFPAFSQYKIKDLVCKLSFGCSFSDGSTAGLVCQLSGEKVNLNCLCRGEGNECAALATERPVVVEKYTRLQTNYHLLSLILTWCKSTRANWNQGSNTGVCQLRAGLKSMQGQNSSNGLNVSVFISVCFYVSCDYSRYTAKKRPPVGSVPGIFQQIALFEICKKISNASLNPRAKCGFLGPSVHT